MRKGLVIAAGWVGAIAAATAVGVIAVSALGDDGATSGPLSRHDVSDRLAQTTPTRSGGPTAKPRQPSPRTSATTAPASTPQRQYFSTTGGALWASCTDGRATLDTMTPRQGYRLDGSDRGPAAAAWVRFKVDVQHGHADEYLVTITCAAGAPQSAETADT
jgi:hypothetical protein